MKNKSFYHKALRENFNLLHELTYCHSFGEKEIYSKSETKKFRIHLGYLLARHNFCSLNWKQACNMHKFKSYFRALRSELRFRRLMKDDVRKIRNLVKIAISELFVRPIRERLNYQKLGRKIISVNPLSENI